MRLRTFTATDMPTAMRQVRDALGENAVILTSESDRGKGVRITAAVDQNDDPQVSISHNPRLREPALKMAKNDPAADHLRFELQNILRFHNLPELFVAKIIQKASDADLSSILALHGVSRDRSQGHLFRMALENLLGKYFSFLPLRMESPGARILLVGPPGVGKTLTIAKLATRIAMDKQLHTQEELAVFTIDNKRAGGVEQLQVFTNILGLPLTVAPTREKLHQHLKALPKQSRVLIDTAGCNPYDDAELEELQGFASFPGVEPVMVLPAGGDSLEAIDMVEAFTAALPIKRLLVTHADMARRFGGVLAAAAAHGLSYCNASASASIVDTLQPIDSALLAQFLLRYQLQSE